MVRIRIKELIEERGLSLNRVSKDTEIEYTTLYRYFAHQTVGIQLRHIETLCKYFKIGFEGLFKYTHQRQGKNKKSL